MLNHKVRTCVIKCTVLGVPWQSAGWNLTEYYSWIVVSQVTGPETAKKGCHWLRKVLSYVIITEVFPLDFHHVPIRKLPGSLFLYISRQIDNGKHQIQCNKTEQWEPRSVLMQTLLFSTKELRTKRKHQGPSTRPRDTHGHPTAEAAWGQEATIAQRGAPATALTADNRTCQPWRPHKRNVPGDLESSFPAYQSSCKAKQSQLNNKWAWILDVQTRRCFFLLLIRFSFIITGTPRRCCKFSSRPDHCSRLNSTIKWVTQIFWFLVHITFIPYYSL